MRLPAYSQLHDTGVPQGTVQCLFFGLAGDGTVGANNNVVRITGDNT